MYVIAPLSGVVVPLESNPDPVFARKMVGDGTCIDPVSSEVLAPVSGEVTLLHPSHHALTIATVEGVEILVHVGLDTISLRGRGFVPLVAQGCHVEVGQPLLRFDPESVAREARSLLTEVLVTDVDRVERIVVAEGLVEAGRSRLMEVVLRAPVDAPAPAEAPRLRSAPIIVPNPAGLHARPAAVLSERARRFAGSIWLRRGDEEANAKSVVSLMRLGTSRGDEVVVEATGEDAQAAIDDLVELIRQGCGEPSPAPARGLARVVRLLEPSKRVAAEPTAGLHGTPASPGLALGRVVQLRQREVDVEPTGRGPKVELEALASALSEARDEIEELATAETGARAEILGVQTSLLEDPDLLEQTRAGIEAGSSAAFAWQKTYRGQADALASLPNPVLKERASDVRDVGRRVLTKLSGEALEEPSLPEDAVVVAEEVTPSEMTSFDRTKLAGLVTMAGSPTSHVAILAKNLGIPALCGVDPAALALADGTRVLVDGDEGNLFVDPDAHAIADAQTRIERDRRVRAEERAAAMAPAQTHDGHRVEVAANICGLEDAEEALSAGAEAVGLLRSEFLFYDREAAPTEDEQADTYIQIAVALGPHRPFVIRTLDVGGDKPLGYLPLPKEANPFLGLRGLRVSLAHQELFRAQLRAIARAAPIGNVRIMFPMVAGLDDLLAGLHVLDEELAEVRDKVQVGAMVEVPSAAILAERLAREVDFFSIGTNDLTQYTLAMDRGHAVLARKADALHPAVLSLISSTVQGAHAHGRWVGVCGGVASDPIAVPALVGLGVDELSVSVPAIPSVKATLARWTVHECEAIAADVLDLATAEEVRRYLAMAKPAAQRDEASKAEMEA